jgi:Mg-chelatase subunit ChlD
MKRAITVTIAGALFGALMPLAAQTGTGISLEFSQKPVLMECEPGGGEPCFRLRFGFVDASGHPTHVPLPPLRELAPRTEIQVDGQPAAPFYAAASNAQSEATQKPQIAMLLIDVSGSMLKDDMAGQTRFDAARQAAAAFLEGFTDGRDRVAIASFSGKDVQAGIDGARFVSTRSEAKAELDALAAPERRNNTALYSAVSIAANRLASEAHASHAEARLLLLTDGANDVQPKAGDDANLLDGNAGLEQAAKDVEKDGVSVLPIGLGSEKTLDVRALTRLGTRPPLITLDRDALRKAFLLAQVSQMSDVTVAIKAPAEVGSRDLLAGRLLRFRAKFTLADGTILVEDRPALWAAPPVATPSFHEEASEAEQRAYIGSSHISETSPWSMLRPVLVFLGFAALLAFLWHILPRWIWPERYQAKLARPVRPEYWPGRDAASIPGHYVPRPAPPGFEAGAYPPQGAMRQPGDNTIVKAVTDFTVTKTRLN